MSYFATKHKRTHFLTSPNFILANRLRKVAVQVGFDSTWLTTVTRHPGSLALGAKCAILFEVPLRGRYVKVLLETTEYFDPREIEVFSKL